jgi:AraC-like DNA-binding protein
VLAAGLDATFGVALDPNNPASGYRTCRTAVILPNTLHHLDHASGRMAFLYVDARSSDLERLKALARVRSDRACFDLRNESEWLDVLRRLGDAAMSWSDARRELGAMLADGGARLIDPRVGAAVRRLHAAPSERLPLADLARGAGLSESRFLHLFRRTTGVPLRRYKLWVAMAVAMRAVTSGQTLTSAALDAGFSSSAHFSAAFREMFGLEPSRFVRDLATISRE